MRDAPWFTGDATALADAVVGGEFSARGVLERTLDEPPAPIGRFAMRNPDFIAHRLGPEGLWRYTPFTPLANATGAASISLPAGRSAAGLPIGAMLTAPFGADALLLRVAAQWEAEARARGEVAVPIAPGS
jgi:Asp-tRNA(Asn)/Glu-tRNA(Gln) amidotransferase A subunit family amidase